MKKNLLVLPLLMVLASCGGAESANPSTGGQTSTPPTSTPAPTITPIADVRSDAITLGNEASETTYTVEGTITGIVGRSYHIQNGNDAIYVYFGTSTTATPAGFAVGKKIRVTGYAKQYNGLVQIAVANKVDIVEEMVGDGDTITPLVITDLSAYETNNISSRLVNINGLKYVSGVNTPGTSSRTDVKFSLGEKNIYAYIDKTMTDALEQAIATKLSGFTAGTTLVNYTGNVAWNSTVEGAIAMNLMATSADNFVVA